MNKKVTADDHAPDELNGTPEEFPHRSEAMDLYRVLWMAYLGHWGPPYDQPGRHHHHWKLHVLLDYMDDLREGICHGPGTVWEEFGEALPGFVDYWNSPLNFSYSIHHHE
jgi:hypothetical protein